MERITGEDYKNVSTELRSLESIGLLTSSKSGNLKYFHLNPGFLIYSELKSIFFKVRGAPGLLKQVLSDCHDIEYAFLCGSFATGTENEKSGIDLMVVGGVPLEGFPGNPVAGRPQVQNEGVAYDMTRRLDREAIKVRILSLLKDRPLRNADIRNFTDLVRQQAYRIMKELESDDLVYQEGHGQAELWYLKQSLRKR